MIFVTIIFLSVYVVSLFMLKTNYIREAILEPLNILAIICFCIFAIYELHWMPLLAGFILETVFLTTVPTSNPYKRLVQKRQAKRLRENRKRQREDLIKTFDQREREAVEYLRWMKNKIYENYSKSTYLSDVPTTVNSLDNMWESFVDLLDMYRKRKNHLRSINRQSIQNQIIQSQRTISQVDPSTKILVEKNIEILNQRLYIYDEIEKGVRHVEVQLQAIENSFSLVNDQIVTMNTLDSITALDPTIEMLLSNIEITKKILEDSTPIMNSLSVPENINNPLRHPQAMTNQ